MRFYIYQRKDWPQFTWDNDYLISPLGKVRNMQGKLVGKMESLGFNLKAECTISQLAPGGRTQPVIECLGIDQSYFGERSQQGAVLEQLIANSTE